ncbi:MDR family MFS transporter [Embleya sp. NBC_00896]|uniref:MDR family MFS transporter n=1 Tax=Embleya sp. NBC_00896 TaxID=2975961 RepID=UPI002F90F0C0|nr:multidrug efflux MFS transporter [Embleya sp. NBC_00896]
MPSAPFSPSSPSSGAADVATASDPRLDPALLKLALVVVVGSITAMLDMTMVTVALADLTHSFHAPVGTVQWVGTAYLLAIATTIPPTARLVERFGARRMWLFALTVFLLGSVLCGAAWSLGSLIAFRALQGIGGGMIVPLSMMILATAAGPERRGRVLGIVAVPAQVAPILGPLLGGAIVQAGSWRWIFHVNVPVCALALVLAWRGLPRDDRGDRTSTRLDFVGLALLSPALALLVYGLSRLNTDPGGLLPLGCGVALLVGYVAHALRTSATPLLDPRLFAHRAFAAASALSFLSRLSIFGAMILMPLYYQQVRGHGALTAGLLLAPQSLGTMLALPLVGRLTDRIGARPVVLAGIAVGTLGTVAFTQVGAHTDDFVLAASLLVWGMGVAAVVVPVSVAAYQGLAPTSIPGATAAITTVQTIGASVGAAVLAAILQDRTTRHPGTPAAAFADTFWWILGFTALTVIPALVLPLHRRKARTGRRAPSDAPLRS